MSELLVELFSEEIPARFQTRGAEEFKQIFLEKIRQHHLTYDTAVAYVTPRRIVLHVTGIPELQSESVIEKRGPRTDANDHAIEGFLRSVGLSNREELEVRPTEKGSFYFAISRQKGMNVAEILSVIIPQSLHEMSWPKSMCWGDHPISWVRPLQNILCLFDGKILPVHFGHLTSNRTSWGHRFLAPDAFEVHYFADYLHTLREHFVILNQEERKQIILKEAAHLANNKGLILKEDMALLEEVTGLVEWPNVLMGEIEKDALSLPKEVLITAMRTHQKYFSLEYPDGTMAPYFIVVSNMVTQDQGQKIIAGNERVLRARLSDAKFFWTQDCKQPLSSRILELHKMVFHAKLGTMEDKYKRMEELATFLAVWVPHANLPLVARACALSKADLATEMVGEFPELQGIMGSYYAAYDQEPSEVVEAIRDHYYPLGPQSPCPVHPVSICVALADKIDLLVGLFSANEKPTGSKDPFALRRAALGIIRIILENQLSIPLKLVLDKSMNTFPIALFKSEKEKLVPRQQRLTEELMEFFVDRLKISLKSQSIRHDLIQAVFADGEEDDLLRLVSRVIALQDCMNTEEGVSLIVSCKRVVNILSAEEKKDKITYGKEPAREKLIQKEEQQLMNLLEVLKPKITNALKEDRFHEALVSLLELRSPIEQFFEHVTVNCENADIRKNRLFILAQIRHLVTEIAQIDNIET